MRSRLNSTALTTALVVLVGVFTGCETQSFFDPSEMAKYRKKPLLVPILDNLDTGFSEDVDQRFASATPPRASDLVPIEGDYTIAPNDFLTISITDLVVPGQETYKQMRVSQTGFIWLPFVGQVKASGLTEGQLQDAISQAYRDANIIQNAQVSVTTVEARGRAYSILGSVNAPGQYVILQNDFRLLDALVNARDVSSQGLDTVYIIRRVEQDPSDAGVDQPAQPPATQPAPDVFTPPNGRGSVAPAERAPRAEAPVKRVAWLKTQEQPATQPTGDREGRIIIIDGKPVQVDGTEQTPAVQPRVEDRPAEEAAPAQPFEFNEPKEPSDVRVIRVPLDALKRGELRYNVVIRAQDMIIVPDPMIGEYYMGGHVSRTGVYSLTARKITLTQAVISAGMLDPVAMPYRTEIRRRVGDREIIARVDLSKIFNGEEPNIYMKPYDSVMVGTNAFAPFLAALRNGFRMTYGFGFLYDRNYFDDDNDGGF